MFSKNITLKNTQNFKNAYDPKNTFTLNIEIKSNHNVDQNTLLMIEQHINNLTTINYTKITEEKK